MADLQMLGVVGAGPMGAGIAQTALASGLAVVLLDVNQEAMRAARKEILSRLARLVEKGKLPAGFVDEASGRLTLANALADFAGCDAVIEAIVERLEPKRELFAQLEAVVREDTLLASNTSSLSIAAIAAGCRNKTRICGLHFFNPVPLMQLVEVIVAPSTSEATTAAALALSAQLGKTPVRVKDGPGFLVNLAGRAYVTEALHVVHEGVADIETVDRILRDAAGFRMGPFQLMDLTGIDVNFPATMTIYRGYQHDPRLKTAPLHELMMNAGRYGQKTGQGFHAYSTGAPPAARAPLENDRLPFSASIPEPCPALDTLRADYSLTMTAGGINLVAPLGEDTTAVCARLGLDPRQTVAIDCTALDNKHLTVMSAPGGGAAAAEVARWLRSHGLRVEVIKDSPGFVLQRVLAMIANLGCELAQIGVGTPQDINTAMRLAQNYPKGPLEWADHLGLQRTHTILLKLQEITGSDRYRPSLWLRRRALLGLSSTAAN
jgi:3-hydroxybutyryl-CoA dehydrogenase